MVEIKESFVWTVGLVAVHFKDNVTCEKELVVCSSGEEALSEF